MQHLPLRAPTQGKLSRKVAAATSPPCRSAALKLSVNIIRAVRDVYIIYNVYIAKVNEYDKAILFFSLKFEPPTPFKVVHIT